MALMEMGRCVAAQWEAGRERFAGADEMRRTNSRYKFALGIWGGWLACTGGGTRKDTGERWLDFDVLSYRGTYVGRIRTVPYAVMVGEREAIYYIWTKVLDSGEEEGMAEFCHGREFRDFFTRELTQATMDVGSGAHKLMWELANRGDSLKNYKGYEGEE